MNSIVQQPCKFPVQLHLINKLLFFEILLDDLLDELLGELVDDSL